MPFRKKVESIPFKRCQLYLDEQNFVSLHLKLMSVAKGDFCLLQMGDYSTQADKFRTLLEMMEQMKTPNVQLVSQSRTIISTLVQSQRNHPLERHKLGFYLTFTYLITYKKDTETKWFPQIASFSAKAPQLLVLLCATIRLIQTIID